MLGQAQAQLSFLDAALSQPRLQIVFYAHIHGIPPPPGATFQDGQLARHLRPVVSFSVAGIAPQMGICHTVATIPFS